MIALLGKGDPLTDGVKDYCTFVGDAMRQRGGAWELAELDWENLGWVPALRRLDDVSRGWRGQWVLVQYTALAWSRRSFPTRFLSVLRILKRNGARMAVIFHDANPYPGERVVDRLRRVVQKHVMRQTYRIADKCIFTVPLDNVGWLPKNPTHAASIPVCANLPSSDMRAEAPASGTKKMRVAVYAVTAGNEWEVEQVRSAMSEAKKHLEELELVMIGRGTEVYGSAYVEALRGSGVQVNVRGILPVQEVIQELCASDAQLFPRGGLASRRGGVLAGIACGLPIVGYAGPETGFPLTEAGLETAPAYDTRLLGEALVRVLTDDAHRAQLRERSRRAYAEYFSPSKIAEQIQKALEN
jgi:glycosyltransferase involved in cell wall biosynthesis